MSAEMDAYDSLCAYTLARRESRFIYTNCVDAFAAQHADESIKPIKVAFALVGLYLLVEKQFTGRDVQRVHMRLGQKKHSWPKFALPRNRGSLTAVDVMSAPEGPERDDAIRSWCASVWAAYAGTREAVVALLRVHEM